MAIKQEIRRAARHLGIDRVGFAAAGDVGERGGLQGWLDQSHHATMRWMAARPARRSDPRQVLDGARTVISAAVNYFHPQPATPAAGGGRISRYAWGGDYHRIIKRQLLALVAHLQQEWPDLGARVYVDTGPVLEKTWAHLAGVGWMGKNGNIITRERGSWVFLGEILLDRQIEPDGPATDHCGSCTRCMTACPTAAIVAPRVVDARRCISYLTIEHRGAVAPEFRASMGNWLFGCDICQEVCPWNKFAATSGEARFAPRAGNADPSLIEMAALDQAAFDQRFQGSNVRRVGWTGFLRNTMIALGNGGDAGSARPALVAALAHPDAVVRAHAAWALGRIGERQPLREQLAREADQAVQCELRRALAD